jgi:chitin disaccharide deacetylase
MSEARIRLITRADDAGTNSSANVAIREAFEKGILRNVSVMACCPAIEEAATLLAGETPLCCGLHATLNAEWDSVRWGPVLPPERVPSLVDAEGYFLQTTRALHERQPNEAEIFAELEAQLAKLRALGFDVRYADMHMGWGWVLPGLMERFSDWCAALGIFHNEVCHRWLPDAAREDDRVERLIAQLSVAEPGQYVIVGHPAYDNDAMRSLGHDGYPGAQVAAEREWERRMFMDTRIVTYCRENGVVPIRYDEAERLR